MKVSVKTLKGTHFQIEVKPEDTVADVKKAIETSQGSETYPASQQMLIHQGKVLKDETTLEENKVVENSFIVIMLSKAQPATAAPQATQPVTAPQPPTTVSPPQATPESAPAPPSAPASAPAS
ncbi:hypothetical protein M9H77_05501 [Catharanthus roseus]|uniref:Uncharacterized protein n=1 Tax=Catharanthus roseus TaxID=4058 RepID=A0ACC0CHI7_CATRO|nr:hypothetical protein M9H77_05501 [Catharanthus roseus]